MDAFHLLAETTSGGGQIEEIARSFGVDWTHLIAQIISFCIVCALLYRFAYQPVLKMLELRRHQIAEGLANTEKIKAELAQVEAKRHEMMKQASAHATRLIDEARAAAARVQAEETQRAIAAAEQILAKTREAAARDHERMLIDLRREVGRLVVQTTAAVIGRTLTPEDQERLVLQTIAAVDGSGPASEEGTAVAGIDGGGQVVAGGRSTQWR
jgi:F-type H+-transporting ATPase subunit b